MKQDMTNPYKNLPLTPYQLMAAGEGARNILMPDGSIVNCSDIKRDLNYPQLFAWNLEPKALLEWVDFLKNNPEHECKLVVDSGAYSMWSRGLEFDIDKYINFLNSNDVLKTAFWAAEADVIPGKMNVDPTEEERAQAPENSWKNYIYMIERVEYPKKIVPIFHMGEDFKHLHRMLNYTFSDGDHIPYLGISPRNDVHVNEKIKWYQKVWKIIRESKNPNVLTHNFGMTSIALMDQYPSYSSDSTSWLRSASFGSIMIVVDDKVKTVYVSNRKLNSPDHINNQSLALRESVEELCNKIGKGITLKHLVEDDDKGNLRMVFNLYSLDLYRKNFKYKGNDLFENDLW